MACTIIEILHIGFFANSADVSINSKFASVRSVFLGKTMKIFDVPLDISSMLDRALTSFDWADRFPVFIQQYSSRNRLPLAVTDLQ